MTTYEAVLERFAAADREEAARRAAFAYSPSLLESVAQRWCQHLGPEHHATHLVRVELADAVARRDGHDARLETVWWDGASENNLSLTVVRQDADVDLDSLPVPGKAPATTVAFLVVEDGSALQNLSEAGSWLDVSDDPFDWSLFRCCFVVTAGALGVVRYLATSDGTQVTCLTDLLEVFTAESELDPPASLAVAQQRLAALGLAA